jgi:hypothetical protein
VFLTTTHDCLLRKVVVIRVGVVSLLAGTTLDLRDLDLRDSLLYLFDESVGKSLTLIDVVENRVLGRSD